MLRSKHLVGLILAATLMATLIPFSTMVYAQNSDGKRAEKFVELAERAGDKVKNFIDIIYANETAIATIEGEDLLWQLEYCNETLVEAWGQGNLTEARDALEVGDFSGAVANATEALSVFREVFKALNTILTEAGVERGELIDAQGLIEAMKRALDRIERIREIVGVAPYSFATDGAGSAAWSTVEAYSGNYSVKLDVIYEAATFADNYAGVVLQPPPGVTTLNDLESASFYYKLVDGVFSPFLDIALDTSDPPDGDADEWLLGYPDSHSWISNKTDDPCVSGWESETGATYPIYSSDPGWVEQTPVNDMWIVAVPGAPMTLPEAKDYEHAYDCGKLGNATIVAIKVWNGQWFMCEEDITAYVDLVTVNGTVVFDEPGVFSILAILDSAEEYLDIETAIVWLSEGNVTQTAWNLTQANQLISLAHSSLKKKAGELNVKKIESYLKVIGKLYNKTERLVDKAVEKGLPGAEDLKKQLEEEVWPLIGEAEGYFIEGNYSDAIASLIDARNTLKEIERAIVESRKGGPKGG